jgi:inner membrane protein
MDNLTHTLTGVTLAQAGLGRSSRGAALALALASNLPDVDILAGLQGAAAYLEHHRDLSHSVVGAPVFALALAGVLRATLKGSRFGALLGCSLLGVAVHVFMDLWTSYGTRVFAPFDRSWYAWDVVFIVDPLVLLLLLASVLWARRAGPRVATATLGLLLAYVGGRAVLHAQALDAAVARVPAGPVRLAAALPTPLNPLRWRALVDTGSAYWTGDVRLDGSPASPLSRRLKPVETAAATRVRESSRVASVFLDFSRFPWLSVEQTPTGTEFTWTDLRYERPGRASFVTRVVVDPEGRILSEAFRF